MSITETIMHLFALRGDSAYFGEPVSQTEHGLQCARLAEQENASDALVVAALLHDVGHLVHEEGEDAADRRIDARHEAAGEQWLATYFGPEVTEPVRLHVAAKRYLCTTDEEYLRSLSPASRQSFVLQGGKMLPEEIEEFRNLRYFHDALRLRHWDDAAKVPGLATRALESYRDTIETLVSSHRVELAS